jgi:hypothetical protein
LLETACLNWAWCDAVVQKWCRHTPRTPCIISDLTFSRRWLWGMLSCGMWYRVGHVTADVLEKLIASIITLEEISELGTTLAVTRNWMERIREEWKLLAIKGN